MDFRTSQFKTLLIQTFLRSICFALSFLLLAPLALARPLDRLDKMAVEERLSELRHQPLATDVKENLVDRDSDCWYSTADVPVLDPNSGQMRALRVFISRPVTRKPTPAVLVVPTIEGRTILESRISSSLCENGITAIVADVNNPDQPLRLPGWGLEDENFRWAIHALRTVIDFAQAHPLIERDQIGIMGGSLGGITAALLAGVDDRIKAVVMAAGGGNLPAILSYSSHHQVVGWRQRRMRNLGISDISEYENILREKIRHDPLHFVDRVNSQALMMVLVKGDYCVPEENQVEYWQAAKQPRAIWMRYSHVATLVRVAYFAMDDISAFYYSHFGP